ncbi:MAG TPA: hypothetical protein VIH28_08355 [Ignavibacteriaceae bacterium]
MIRLTVFFLIILFSGCRETAYLTNKGVVREINCRYGYVLVEFECVQQRYENQPCGATVPFDINEFGKAELGQVVKISGNLP